MSSISISLKLESASLPKCFSMVPCLVLTLTKRLLYCFYINVPKLRRALQVFRIIKKKYNTLSVFSHLDFSDSTPSRQTAGLFSYKNCRKSAKTVVLSTLVEQLVSSHEMFFGPRCQDSHPCLLRSYPSILVELDGLPAKKLTAS